MSLRLYSSIFNSGKRIFSSSGEKENEMKTIELFMSTKVLTPIKDGGCERLAGWNRAVVGKKVPGWILEF